MESGAGNEYIADPVSAYDKIAPVFGNLAVQRKAYLAAIDALIIHAIPPNSVSLLDVGAGDGARARNIAAAAGVSRLTLLEPSDAMRGTAPAPGQVWAIRAESLHLKNAETFHVITCLWNVLGHIFPAAARLEVLRQCARLVAPQGRIFIDVNHRYNARHYGFAATALRMLRDRLSPGENNGDVKVTWPLAGAHCSTAGHVFTHTEFASLCRAAGLIIERRVVVDYASGKQRHRSLGGHLLYELRPA